MPVRSFLWRAEGLSSHERNSPPDCCCQTFGIKDASRLEFVSSPSASLIPKKPRCETVAFSLNYNEIFNTGCTRLQKLHFLFWVAFQCNLFSLCNPNGVCNRKNRNFLRQLLELINKTIDIVDVRGYNIKVEI